ILDGKVVDYTVEEYTSVKEILDALQGKGLYVTNTTDSVTIKETEKSSASVVVRPGDKKLDFNEKLTDDKGQLIGFKNKLTKIDVVETMVITVKNVNEIDVNDLFDGVRLTSKGMELVEALNKDKEATLSQLPELPGFNAEVDGLTRLDITVNKKTITVAGEFRTMKEFRAVLENRADMTISSLAGDDRFATAIEVSKAGFEDGQAGAVVLVGQDAIVDGLAAAPLAKAKKAPILLAKKDGLTEEVEKEMLRVLGTTGLGNKTIYIVGGESQISKEAEAKLAKLGTKVVRLSGDDRYATSLAIAEEVTKEEKKLKPAFVVGGEGEVDAMSISAHAAKEEAPIVVVNKDVVSEDAKEFMADREIVVVGGKSSVSEEVVAELDVLDKIEKNVKRLAGDDRQGTNAAVINEYYNKNHTTAFVAKDGYVGGKSQLIDALTAAPLAGNAGAPIVLATNNVTVEQKEAVQSNFKGVKKIVQIGQGIADSVITKIAEIVKGN
ncbi:MAG: cell wall-binding repeat-containing protein, partial [Romboutsia timonensis]